MGYRRIVPPGLPILWRILLPICGGLDLTLEKSNVMLWCDWVQSMWQDCRTQGWHFHTSSAAPRGRSLYTSSHTGESCPTHSATVANLAIISGPEVTQTELCPIHSSTGKRVSIPAVTRGRALTNPQLHGVEHFYNSSHPGESPAQPAAPRGRASLYK